VNLKNQSLKKELNNLFKFLDGDREYLSQDIISWIGECVEFFTRININEIILRDFIESFDIQYKNKSSIDFYIFNSPFGEDPERIGPFKLDDSKMFFLWREILMET